MPNNLTLITLVRRARSGDDHAFARLVHDFQDMAVGYAVTLTGDFHLAEDAAQEAFVAAHGKLSELREEAAFPGWFRMIVRTACHRHTRKAKLDTVPIDTTHVAGVEKEEDEGNDMSESILGTVWDLPEAERSVITLSYVSRYSHQEIADFLEIPVTTVQGRLRTGRDRLKERMIAMAKRELNAHAPSRDARFEDRVKRLVRPKELDSEEERPWAGGRGTDVWKMITSAIRGDLDTIRRLVDKDARLVNCTNQYRSPLHFAVQENHIDVVEFLLAHGADATHRSGNPWHERPIVIAEERGYAEMKNVLETHLKTTQGGAPAGDPIAAAIRERDVSRVRELLDGDASLLEALDERGNRPMHWAALVRSIEIATMLLDLGADVNAQRPDGARPLDLTDGDYWFRGNRDVPKDGPTQQEMSEFLIDRGARYDITAAAKLGDLDRVSALLEEDASLANAIPDYCTYYNGVPLWEAVRSGHQEIAELLLEKGADPTTPEPGMAPKGRVLAAAVRGEIDFLKRLLEMGADPNGMIESSGNAMSAAVNAKNWDALKLMAGYGGQIPDWMDLSDVAPEALDAVYDGALPLKYFVDTEDTASLSARFDEDADQVKEVLHLSLGSYWGFRPNVLKLCLTRDPGTAKTVHCYGLMYKLHRLEEDEVIESFRLLLEAGMTPNDPNWMRVTPLHLLSLGATHHGTDGRAYRAHPKMMALFIEHGADLEAIDEEYQSTPLGWAARWGRKEAVELLLERGAKVEPEGCPAWAMPIAWAEKKGHNEIVEVLKEASGA